MRGQAAAGLHCRDVGEGGAGGTEPLHKRICHPGGGVFSGRLFHLASGRTYLWGQPQTEHSWRQDGCGDTGQHRDVGRRSPGGCSALPERGWGVCKGADAGRVLWSFLEGTDSLWGMVDWEEGTCDFDTPLFGKLLEAARRFGDDGRKQPEAGIIESRWFHDIFRYDSLEEQESEGKVSCGVLFDDGCYGAVRSTFTMAVNANSTHKEGAWEFLRFLLGVEVQNADSATLPVNREAFEQWLQRNVEQGSNLITQEGVFCYTKEDITAKKQAEYRKAIEEARPYPIRTVPLLNIIQEEAAEYFGGVKSVEEVSRVVTNRVQLYLDEWK